jgi:hypothetical protein
MARKNRAIFFLKNSQKKSGKNVKEKRCTMSTERRIGKYRVVGRCGNWYILDPSDFFVAVFKSRWEAIKFAKNLDFKKRATALAQSHASKAWLNLTPIA